MEGNEKFMNTFFNFVLGYLALWLILFISVAILIAKVSQVRREIEKIGKS